MARPPIQTVVTPLYDKHGKHVLDRTEEWVIDQRTGLRHMIQDPPRPTRLRTTQAPVSRRQAPEERLRTMSEAERRQIALKALTAGVPPVASLTPRIDERIRANQGTR